MTLTAKSTLRLRSMNSLGFYTAGMGEKQAGRIRLFFPDHADLKSQSAGIDASGPAGFFPVSEHPKKKYGGFVVNKRNRG